MPAQQPPVGVIGAGHFGVTVANLVAQNRDVLLCARRPEAAAAMQRSRTHDGLPLHPRVRVLHDMHEVAARCTLIFPIVPSAFFRDMMRALGPHLRPYHLLVHGTKGLDIVLARGQTRESFERLHRSQIMTMSEVVRQESVVVRVGCISGPNLSAEIAAGQPAATVVASRFDEVLREVSDAMRSPRFRVHSSHDLLGVELAGTLKNILALASGALAGLGYGQNMRGLLIARGLAEMIHIGQAFGASPKAFLGIAGIGDTVATCFGESSRNFTVGKRLASGETLPQILASMDQAAEGIMATRIMDAMTQQHGISAPIIHTLYRVLHGTLPIQRAVQLLMEFPFSEDVEFL